MLPGRSHLKGPKAVPGRRGASLQREIRSRCIFGMRPRAALRNKVSPEILATDETLRDNTIVGPRAPVQTDNIPSGKIPRQGQAHRLATSEIPFVAQTQLIPLRRINSSNAHRNAVQPQTISVHSCRLAMQLLTSKSGQRETRCHEHHHQSHHALNVVSDTQIRNVTP